METKNKYSLIVNTLKKNRPELTGKEKLRDDILRKIRESGDQITSREKLLNYLFRWTDSYWLRGAMTSVALIITLVFISQQIFITNRIAKLEEQLVITVNMLAESEPGVGIIQKTMLNMVLTNQQEEDSITVSRSDLYELLKSYKEIENDFNSLKPQPDSEPLY